MVGGKRALQNVELTPVRRLGFRPLTCLCERQSQVLQHHGHLEVVVPQRIGETFLGTAQAEQSFVVALLRPV